MKLVNVCLQTPGMLMWELREDGYSSLWLQSNRFICFSAPIGQHTVMVWPLEQSPHTAVSLRIRIMIQ